MKLKVLFFASLRDSSGIGQMDIDVDAGLSIDKLWGNVSKDFQSLPDKVLYAVNQEYVNSNYLLKEGDTEVAFFPPVTGG